MTNEAIIDTQCGRGSHLDKMSVTATQETVFQQKLSSSFPNHDFEATKATDSDDEKETPGALQQVMTRNEQILTHILIWLFVFALGFSNSIFRVLTPYVVSDYKKHALTATTDVVANIASGIFRLPYAKLLDVWGRPQSLSLMVLFTVLGAVMKAGCDSVEPYCAAQVFYYVGYYGIQFSLVIFIFDSAPIRNRALLFGIVWSPSHGRKPFYLIADGTGTIATYIHLPQFKSQVPIYGIDSPFLRCPTRFTTDVGITGAARYITEALTKAQPEGAFDLGGFSGGAMLAYEVCRQLATFNREVDGLMLIDMCSPRSKTVEDKNDIGWAIFESISRQNGLWRSTDMTRQHLHAIFAAVATYHPQSLKASQRPKRTAIIWAEKGMIDRCAGDSELMEKLAKRGIPTEPYPRFMEDSELGPVAWVLPHKTKNDLGPNGWDRYIGETLCLSMPADHLETPMPGHVHLLHETMARAFEYFEGL